MFHRLTRIFQPISILPKNAQVKKHEITSKSQKLMLDLGIIKQASPGCFHFLPLGIRSLDKLIRIVDNEMQTIDGQKVVLPSLTNSKLWETSGRIHDVSSELFTLKDRHDQSYILSPTHEEAITDLMASISPVSYKQFPLRLYQITSKFRDEMKPRFGLMRAKQFIMKDLYSFDIDLNHAKHTYNEISECYDRIFKQIGINFVKVIGNTGHIGGSLSHEYHYKADIGEDKVLTCKHCNYSANSEVVDDGKCLNCKNDCIEISSGIEVGHTFLLEDKYSKPLKATYLRKDGKSECLQMGCYGLGITRILAAVIEILSNEQEIRWPLSLAPYLLTILPPKSGSKEELHLNDTNFVESLYKKLENLEMLRDNIVIDDRVKMTIGKRFLEAKRVGYPFILVLGQKILENPPLFELNDLNKNQQLYLNENDLFNYFQQINV